MNNEKYVIVKNKMLIIPLRHIVTIDGPYNEDGFKKWYYKNYHKLKGDEFICCETKDERDRILKEINV